MFKVKFIDDGTELILTPIDAAFLRCETGAMRKYTYNDDTPTSGRFDWYGPKNAFEETYGKRFPSKQFRCKIDQKVEDLLKP